MLRCIIVLFGNNYCDGLNVSTTFLLQCGPGQFMPLLRLCAGYTALGALLLTFRPLLIGIARRSTL